MEGEPSLAGALGHVLWYVAELFFKFIPGTVISLSGQGAEPPIPAGLSPLTEPVTTETVVTYLERSAAYPGQFESLVYKWDMFVAISMAISLVFGTIVIYCFVRIRQLRYQEHLRFEAGAKTIIAEDIPKTQLRWNRIVEQAASENTQNWRLAILEADIMLNELLDVQGYRGETMGEKMRQVEKASFHTIDEAWEAHKFRNRIAHESAQQLSQREVKRIIGLYERVFREFELIQ